MRNELTSRLLGESERLVALRQAAPDVASRLPLKFEAALSNPCFRDGNGTRRCLPAFFLAGGMQCGVADLWSKLRMHPHVADEHDALSHWWTNHPRSRAGVFDVYLDRFSNAKTLAALSTQPRTLLGEASPATFTYAMAESLRLHYLYLDAFAACHGRCRSHSPPVEHAAACAQRSYDMAHCYAEATSLTVPLSFNVPSMIATTYAARPPRVVALLREPARRLWVAFWTYGQYPAKYGNSADGFLYYFGNQSASFETCVHTDGRGLRKCALRFEGYGAAEANVYYHADQLIKGMYAAFVPEWQAALPASHLLVVTSEDYFDRTARTLRKIVRHLGLKAFKSSELRAAEKSKPQDEWATAMERRMEPSDVLLAPVRRFYRPWNRALTSMLGDDEAFLWRGACWGGGCQKNSPNAAPGSRY